jgi:DNA-binding CsgD family transcriptional regulator
MHKNSIATKKAMQIMELCQKGISKPQIAKIVGVSPKTVYNYQKKLNLL